MTYGDKAHIIGISLMLFGERRTVRWFTRFGWIRCAEPGAIWLA